MTAKGGFEVGFHGEVREIVPKNGLSTPRSSKHARCGRRVERGDVHRGRRARDAHTAEPVCPSRKVHDAIIDAGMEVSGCRNR